MRRQELIDVLFGGADPDPETEVLIRDLDTGYLVGIKSVTEEGEFAVLNSYEYSDDEFPWNDESRRVGSF